MSTVNIQRLGSLRPLEEMYQIQESAATHGLTCLLTSVYFLRRLDGRSGCLQTVKHQCDVYVFMFIGHCVKQLDRQFVCDCLLELMGKQA